MKTKLNETNSSCANGRKQRVFIVDDHPMVREGTSALINQQPDLAMCGEAGDATRALASLGTSKPDVVIVDLSLEGRSGLELIKNIRSSFPKLPVLVYSMHHEDLYAERALRAGAQGYVMKQEPTKQLLGAVRELSKGGMHVSANVANRLLSSAVGARSATAVSPVDELTDRELEVFEMRGEGLSASEIARRLHLSRKTVDFHLENIKHKLDLPNAAELLRRAVQWSQSKKI